MVSGVDSHGFHGISYSVPPQGPEQPTKSLRKSRNSANGGNAGGNIRRELDTIMEIWPNLSPSVRNQCLEWLESQTRIPQNADA
jgi:hypothetical protein